LKLLKKLQECSTIGQADPILTKLGAGPAVKKLVETAIILSNSQDPQQRSHAFQFMESAIKEMENNDVDDENHPPIDKSKQDHLQHDQNEPVSSVQEQDYDNDENDDDDDDKPIHEEVLDNHNNGPREDGSEQSTENREPYPGTARDSDNGEKPMQDMTKTENQWNETGMPPGMGGAPGGMPGGMGQPPGAEMGQGLMPGLAPDVAQEMGMIVPELPPFNTNQMMRQMQYTVNKVVSDLYKKEIAPLHRVLRHQKEIQKQQKDAIKSLSQELRETKNASGNLKFDLDNMRKNKNASFRETVPDQDFQNIATFDRNGLPGVQPINRQQVRLATARSEIEMMDRILNSKEKSIYQ